MVWKAVRRKTTFENFEKPLKDNNIATGNPSSYFRKISSQVPEKKRIILLETLENGIVFRWNTIFVALFISFASDTETKRRGRFW